MSIYANHLFEPGTRNNSWAHLYEYINSGDRVLDVGCSTGRFGEALIHLKRCEVWGVDIDNSDIKEAEKRLNEALVLDINDTGQYKKLGKFDVIIFADVLEHLTEPRVTLKNVKKLLKPKGKIAFSIPHMAHTSVRIDIFKGKFPYKNRGLLDNTHLHFYDLDEIDSIFNDSGYTIERIDPVISKYPLSSLREKLQNTGIVVNKRLERYLSETGGDIFQVVGCAKPQSNKSGLVGREREYIMPQDEMYESIVKLQEENQALRSKLDETLQSTSWKVTKPLRKTSAIAKKIKRKNNEHN